jgi:hypothetical protein
MWHLPNFSKRLELLIKPSGFGYNAYNQAIVVKIPNQVISYLVNYYDIGFIDIDGNTLCFSSKKFSTGTNEVEYYVKLEVVDDINYTSLFVYYEGVGSVDICGSGEPEEYVFDGAYIVNYLDTLTLTSVIGPNFSNHSAALQQPICDTYAAKVTGGTTYISCSVSKSTFTLFFNCYLTSGQGYLVYFSSSNYVYVNIDGSLAAKIDETEYIVGAKLYFNTCSTFSITCDGEKTYIVINGLTKLVINKTFSISEIRLGGNGSSGYSIEGYFFDLFLLPPKLPLYSYYLHNTVYDNSNFFRESGYDNPIVNGYLTHWPEVIFSGDEAIFKSNIDLPTGWKYYRPITITNSGTETIYDYNIVVLLSTNVLGNPYNNISDDGSDLCFISSSGVGLDHCLYSWDNTGYSNILVNSSGTGGISVGDSYIYMYYCGEHSVPTSVELDYPGVEEYDNFNTKDESYWHFDGHQTVPYNLNGQNVLKMWGDNSWKGYYSFEEHIVTGMEVTIDFLRTGSSSWHMAALDNNSGYHRWCIDESSGNIRVQYVIGGSYNYPKTLISNAKTSIWYTVLLRVDDVSGFYMKVWEKDNLSVYGEYSRAMPTGLAWKFRSWQYQNVNGYHDNYHVYDPSQEAEAITTCVGDEIEIGGTLIDIQNNIYKQSISYSVSFDNGSSWHVSNLNYDSMFTKCFGESKEYNTILRLSSSEEIIDKDYITKVNDSNQFYVNYDVDFSAGTKKNGTNDIITDFMTELYDKTDINLTPVEYVYESDLIESYLTRPVEFVWGGALSSGIMSKPVEFCFSDILNSFFYDINIAFWFGRLSQDFYTDIPMDFVVGSKYTLYEDIDVDFCLSNWKYFPHQTDIICSIVNFDNKYMEVSTCDGLLMNFVSDVKASDMLYMDFNSSVFCSVSGISPYYLFDVQTISGSLISYSNDIYCSLLDTSNYNCEIKLNTIIIENFSIDIGDTSTGVQDLCFSVDVYDKEYGVTESGIAIYMNTNTLVGNAVSNLSFSAISGGYSVSWCYDINSLSPLEYVETIVYCVNTVNDINIVSYFLKYGKRYYYNLYHIIKHDYEELIPMLMVAENNVNIFPSFSAETMYVRIENYKRKDISASIFGVGLDRRELQADITALTTNFYNGGAYKVRIECKDLSGNVMDPFEFEFVIRSDGS